VLLVLQTDVVIHSSGIVQWLRRSITDHSTEVGGWVDPNATHQCGY